MAGLGGSRRDREGPRTEVTKERAALRETLGAVEEEKRKALADPGPTWREWWFYSASKWYIGIGLLVADVWVAAYWVEVGYAALALVSILALLYAEFLLYQYLWYRPPVTVAWHRTPFHPTWRKPVARGRWTPEAAAEAAPGRSTVEDDTPDLREFV